MAGVDPFSSSCRLGGLGCLEQGVECLKPSEGDAAGDRGISAKPAFIASGISYARLSAHAIIAMKGPCMRGEEPPQQRLAERTFPAAAVAHAAAAHHSRPPVM